MHTFMFSIGQAQNLTVSIRPANNFPLDVYFLMDQSFSMNDDLQNLKTLASQLGIYLAIAIFVAYALSNCCSQTRP